MCSDFFVHYAVGIDEDCRVLWGVVHGLSVEADKVEEGGEVGRGSGSGLEDYARPERGIIVAGCNEGIGSGGCAVGVFGGNEATGRGSGGIDEVEAGEGQVGVMREVAGTVRGGELVEL